MQHYKGQRERVLSLMVPFNSFMLDQRWREIGDVTIGGFLDWQICISLNRKLEFQNIIIKLTCDKKNIKKIFI